MVAERGQLLVLVQGFLHEGGKCTRVGDKGYTSWVGCHSGNAPTSCLSCRRAFLTALGSGGSSALERKSSVIPNLSSWKRTRSQGGSREMMEGERWVEVRGR